jgi:hypothetical protein
VARRRILFGHQSVGGNLLEGMARLAREHGADGLRIVAVDPKPGDGPAIAHLLIGENEKPDSKITHFDQLMSGPAGQWAEIAFFKLCYADIDAQTDVPTLFESYEQAHELRKARHPNTLFVHLTTPLTTVQRGPKGWLKKLTGGAAWGERENVKRDEYNQLMRRRYLGREPLFDLARLESAGHGASFVHNGRRYESLASDFTGDGGHLNAAGQRALATNLVSFLANLPQR